MLREASWLARWETGRTWRSYPIAVLAWMVGGLLAASVFADVSGARTGREFVSADIFLIAACGALVVNFGSRDSWVSPTASVPDRVAFFRGLPISARQVVASRALSRFPVLVLNATAFFGTAYVLSAIGGGGVARLMAPGTYVWFALIWLGCGLVTGSWALFGELALHGRTYHLVTFVGFLPLVAIVVLEFVFRPAVVARTIDFAQSDGPLWAAFALLAGAAVSGAWLVAASRRLERRDLLA